MLFKIVFFFAALRAMFRTVHIEEGTILEKLAYLGTSITGIKSSKLAYQGRRHERPGDHIVRMFRPEYQNAVILTVA